MICLLWLRLRRLLCSDLLRFFNYIVRVSKIVAYLLRGEVHVDFSSSKVDDCFNSAEEQSPKDDGWIVLVFSHVNDHSECLIFHLELSRPLCSETVT